MAQRPKPEVHAQIVASAAEVFALRGFPGTTMAGIASHSGVPIGNLYRYFKSKEELLAAAIPAEFPRIFLRMLERRIAALGLARDVDGLADDSPYHVLSRESVAFCLAHRHQVVFLLLRARGTSYEPFATDLVRALVRFALRYARKAYPKLVTTPILRATLACIYEDYVGSLGGALASYESEGDLVTALGQRSSYHLAGLKHLFHRSCK